MRGREEGRSDWGREEGRGGEEGPEGMEEKHTMNIQTCKHTHLPEDMLHTPSLTEPWSIQ